MSATTPDPMTPAWSRDLAEVRLSPYWDRHGGYTRRDTFVEQASRYATYDDLPRGLQATFRRAQRELGLRSAPSKGSVRPR